MSPVAGVEVSVVAGAVAFGVGTGVSVGVAVGAVPSSLVQAMPNRRRRAPRATHRLLIAWKNIDSIIPSKCLGKLSKLLLSCAVLL